MTVEARIAKLERQQKPGSLPTPPIEALDLLIESTRRELTPKEQGVLDRWLPIIDAIVRRSENGRGRP